MDTLPERATRVLLIAVGVGTAFGLPSLPADATHLVPLLHQQYLVALLAAGLIAAAFLPSLRLPLVGAGLLAKAGFVAIAASTHLTTPLTLYAEMAGLLGLLCAAALLLRARQQEARWDGAPGWRMEA